MVFIAGVGHVIVLIHCDLSDVLLALASWSISPRVGKLLRGFLCRLLCCLLTWPGQAGQSRQATGSGTNRKVLMHAVLDGFELSLSFMSPERAFAGVGACS